MGHWSRSRFYRVVVVVVEVAMHMRRAKKKKKKDGSASQPITNKLTQPKSNVAFLLITLVEGVPHHICSSTSGFVCNLVYLSRYIRELRNYFQIIPLQVYCLVPDSTYLC